MQIFTGQKLIKTTNTNIYNQRKGDNVEYNVLTEKWLPVVMLDGTQTKVGLRDALINAHNIKSVSASGHMFLEYTNFVLVYLMALDMCRPEDDRDIKEIAEKGCFSEKEIDKYIEECKRDRCTFNLFDEERPFLQKPFDKNNKETASAKKLVSTESTGNNAIFENIPNAEEYAEYAGVPVPENLYTDLYHKKMPALDEVGGVPFDIYLQWIIFRHVGAIAEGCGHIANLITAKSASFIVITGSNLFETIVVNFISSESYDKPLWRWEKYDRFYRNENSLAKLHNLDTLSGMMFPVREIAPDVNSIKDGKIEKIQYNSIKIDGKTVNINAGKIAMEEHNPFIILYKSTKEENKPAKTKLFRISEHEKYPWLSLFEFLSEGGMENHFASYNLITKYYEALARIKSCFLTIYTLQGSKPTDMYFSLKTHVSCSKHAEEKQLALNTYINIVSKIVRDKSWSELRPSRSKENKAKTYFIDNALMRFASKCRVDFMEMQNTKENKDWEKEIREILFRRFIELNNEITSESMHNLRGREYGKFFENKRKIFNKYSKIIKGELNGKQKADA